VKTPAKITSGTTWQTIAALTVTYNYLRL